MADDIGGAPALPATELTLPVDPPVQFFRGRSVTSITLREPTAGDLVSAAGAEAGYPWRVALVAAVSALDVREVECFGVSLLNDCTDYLSGWLHARRNLPFVAVEAASVRHTH